MYGILMFYSIVNLRLYLKKFQPTLRSRSPLRPTQVIEFEVRIKVVVFYTG
jgi:hypothetical protein